MEQMTLWELGQTAESLANPIWEQLAPAVRKDTVVRLSRLMAKAVSINQMHNKQESNHDQ